MQRRFLLSTLALASVAGLGGCAAFTSVTSEVATYGDWPAGRAPGTYVFERLPSQQARSARQAELEAAAARALEAAGFRPAATGAQADVVVQLGARISRTEVSPWDDPLWWRGGFGYYPRRGPWIGPRFAFYTRYEPPTYEREVGLLLRDRASGKPLFEARAASEGHYGADEALLGAMFEAAMTDFPRPAQKPHRVSVPLTQ